MRNPSLWFACVLALAAPAAHPAEKTKAGARGEPPGDAALVYFIRPSVGAGSAIDLFVYANDSFAGVLDNDSYFFKTLAPGHYAIETDREPSTLTVTGGPLNMASIEVDLVAGQTYYLDLRMQLYSKRGPRPVDGTEGERLLSEVKWVSQPKPNQEEKGTLWEQGRQWLRDVVWSTRTDEIIESLKQRAKENPALTPDDILSAAKQARIESHIRYRSLSHVYLDAWANEIAAQRALEQGARDEAVHRWTEAGLGFADTARRVDLPARHTRVIYGTLFWQKLYAERKWPSKLGVVCTRQRERDTRRVACDRDSATDDIFRTCVEAAQKPPSTSESALRGVPQSEVSETSASGTVTAANTNIVITAKNLAIKAIGGRSLEGDQDVVKAVGTKNTSMTFMTMALRGGDWGALQSPPREFLMFVSMDRKYELIGYVIKEAMSEETREQLRPMLGASPDEAPEERLLEAVGATARGLPSDEVEAFLSRIPWGARCADVTMASERRNCVILPVDKAADQRPNNEK